MLCLLYVTASYYVMKKRENDTPHQLFLIGVGHGIFSSSSSHSAHLILYTLCRASVGQDKLGHQVVEAAQVLSDDPERCA